MKNLGQASEASGNVATEWIMLGHWWSDVGKRAALPEWHQCYMSTIELNTFLPAVVKLPSESI